MSTPNNIMMIAVAVFVVIVLVAVFGPVVFRRATSCSPCMMLRQPVTGGYSRTPASTTHFRESQFYPGILDVTESGEEEYTSLAEMKASAMEEFVKPGTTIQPQQAQARIGAARSLGSERRITESENADFIPSYTLSRL
jgi:uncharacterized membrane protein